MGYWKTHTGLDAPARDSTYDQLPIFLGIAPENAYPEAQVDSEGEARAIFQAATSNGLGEKMLRAQLLAAKLNAIKFPGFSDALFPSGDQVGDFIQQADKILDDMANGIPHTKAEIVEVSAWLDAANNNGHEPHILSLFCPRSCKKHSVGNYHPPYQERYGSDRRGRR